MGTAADFTAEGLIHRAAWHAPRQIRASGCPCLRRSLSLRLRTRLTCGFAGCRLVRDGWIMRSNSFSMTRFSWIALATALCGLLVPSNASAGCASMSMDCACQTESCCCSQAEAPQASPDFGSQPVAAVAPFAQNDANCRVGCVCRPESPVVPEPQGQRIEESRADHGRAVEAERLTRIVGVARFRASLPPPGGPRLALRDLSSHFPPADLEFARRRVLRALCVWRPSLFPTGCLYRRLGAAAYRR